MPRQKKWNPKPFKGPAKSVCQCGHTGDGPASQHHDQYASGHGPCKECPCEQFSWKEWTPDFKRHNNI